PPACSVTTSRAHDLAQALSAVPQGRRLRFRDDAALVRRLHETFLEPCDIATEAGHSVALDPAEVRDDEDVRHGLGIRLRHAELRKDFFTKRTQRLLLDHVFLGHCDAPSVYDHELRLWV